MQEDRRLAVLRAIVEDYVATAGAGRLQGPGRAARARRLAGHRAQRHGRARGGGADHPAPHQRRPDPDRQGLPAVRRPADHDQADDARRSVARSPRFLDGAVDLDDVVAALGAAARPAHPAGRDRAVPDAVPLHGAAHRAGRAGSHPAARGADPQHRARRAAAGRARRPIDDDDARRPAVAAQRARPPAGGSPTPPPRSRAARRRRPSDGGTPRRRGRRDAGRGDVRPPLDERVAVGGAANLARFGDSFDAAVRPLLEALEEHVVLLKLLGEATDRRHGHGPDRARGPVRRSWPTTSVVATGYGPGDEALATLGVVGPTRMDYPGTMAAVRAVARYVSRILDEA